MSAVSKSRCIATRTAAPAGRDVVAGLQARGVGALPRLDGHVEMAGRVGDLAEQREVGGVEQAVGVGLHEEVEGLLPVAAGRRATVRARRGRRPAPSLIARSRSVTDRSPDAPPRRPYPWKLPP